MSSVSKSFPGADMRCCEATKAAPAAWSITMSSGPGTCIGGSRTITCMFGTARSLSKYYSIKFSSAFDGTPWTAMHRSHIFKLLNHSFMDCNFLQKQDSRSPHDQLNGVVLIGASTKIVDIGDLLNPAKAAAQADGISRELGGCT